MSNILINPKEQVHALNGKYVIIDDLDRTKISHSGIFYVFSSGGEVIIRKRFRDANILCVDITPDGKFAFCQTADNDIYFYDIEKHRQCRHVESAIRLYHSEQNFHFDIENLRIVATFNDLEYRYHFQGGLYADGDSYLNDALQMQKTAALDLNKVLSLLLCARSNDISPSKEAKLQKALGETYYQLNNMKKAKIHLTCALEENPRCGAKRLLDKIK